ncbi:YlxR family protein [Dissulfurirhabdus thermomarina]|uniref:YlxR family protein n=1 Tax=Dissulfurirhabdus thermomarina TaxID=1765737 RepID=A0A6N9TTC2_DISTH|nr:YlxR family protein [Dissulfurirhabdus thermomarina]NDY43343.1 YlxR family protein [Dissulfurirhabdus thermomarina]NMX23909.1 YlxR family protein [Dissulfurirhabdus thermomarina]
MTAPTRTCIACGRKAEKNRLIRLVARDGRVCLDTRGTLPGRGAYVCAGGGCLERLARDRRGRLHRAFRGPVEPGDLVAAAEAQPAPRH